MKTLHVSSCQTEIETSIKSMQSQTDNPRLKNSHCQTNSVKVLINTLDICEEKALAGSQFCLSFDGLRVSSGTKGKSHGDVNLWGAEKPMSIIKCKEILDSDVSLVEQLEQPVTDKNQSNQILKCERLLLRLTKRIEQLRNRLTGSFLLE